MSDFAEHYTGSATGTRPGSDKRTNEERASEQSEPGPGQGEHKSSVSRQLIKDEFESILEQPGLTIEREAPFSYIA